MRSIWVNSCSISLQSGRFWENLDARPPYKVKVRPPRSRFAYGSNITLNLTATMGNDGGSIPDRRDLVRTKAKVCDHAQHFLASTHRRFRRLSRPTRRIKPALGGFSALSQRSAHQFCNSAHTGSHPMQRVLQEPIVSCALGKLYNKDAILEYLLDKSSYGDGEVICGHIRSLKVSNYTSFSSYTASFTFKFHG